MKPVSRRDFLRLSSLAMGGMAFTPILPQITLFNDSEIARVGTTSVSVYKEPVDTSDIVATWQQDELVNVYETITAKTPETGEQKSSLHKLCRY